MNKKKMNTTKNRPALFILIFSLALMSGCTTTMPDGKAYDVGVLQKFGTWIYNPVYTEEQIGVNLVTKDKITGYKSVTVANPDGTTTTFKEPIIEIVTLEEPVYKNIVTDWQPNIFGKLLKAGFSAIPVPGAEEAAGAALILGAAGMGTQELLRRRKKKIVESEASEKEKEIAIVKAEKDAVTEHFQVSVGAVKDFMKTEKGKAVTEDMKKAFLEKAKEFGVAKGYKTAVNIAKAVL